MHITYKNMIPNRKYFGNVKLLYVRNIFQYNVVGYNLVTKSVQALDNGQVGLSFLDENDF